MSYCRIPHCQNYFWVFFFFNLGVIIKTILVQILHTYRAHNKWIKPPKSNVVANYVLLHQGCLLMNEKTSISGEFFFLLLAYKRIQLLRCFLNGHSLAKRARVTKGYLLEKFSRTWKLVVDLVKILCLLNLITLVLYHREYFTVFRLCMYLEMYLFL